MLRYFPFLLPFLSFFISCNEKVDINAPYKDIYVVYGVLNPYDSVQYIRVSKVFQTEEDAFKTAQENDFSLKGLKVILTGEGKTWEAIEIDSMLKEPENGIFYPYTTVYKLRANYQNGLVVGKRYNLSITNPQDSSLKLTAHTSIPQVPYLLSPRIYRDAISGEYCLARMAFEDTLEVSFEGNPFFKPSVAKRYEVRFSLNYTEGNQLKQYTWRYNSLIEGTGEDAKAKVKIMPKSAFSSFFNQTKDSTKQYKYIREPACSKEIVDLSNALQILVTGLDTNLSNYLMINDPAYPNFNTYRPEYSNIRGTKDAVGIFGSIAIAKNPILFTKCSEYLMHFNNTPPQGVSCE